jgi:hypothetical protein
MLTENSRLMQDIILCSWGAGGDSPPDKRRAPRNFRWRREPRRAPMNVAEPRLMPEIPLPALPGRYGIGQEVIAAVTGDLVRIRPVQ